MGHLIKINVISYGPILPVGEALDILDPLFSYDILLLNEWNLQNLYRDLAAFPSASDFRLLENKPGNTWTV